MLYHEFMEGTGCKDNDHNYQVYKELEIIYMNTNCTKQHIYDMGKKLVDNSKSEELLQFEAKLKSEIEEHKAEIVNLKQWIENDTYFLKIGKAENDKESIKFYTFNIKAWKERIKEHKREINKLKWVLE